MMIRQYWVTNIGRQSMLEELGPGRQSSTHGEFRASDMRRVTLEDGSVSVTEAVKSPRRRLRLSNATPPKVT